jgi:hypothetical protein
LVLNEPRNCSIETTLTSGAVWKNQFESDPQRSKVSILTTQILIPNTPFIKGNGTLQTRIIDYNCKIPQWASTTKKTALIGLKPRLESSPRFSFT